MLMSLLVFYRRLRDVILVRVWGIQCRALFYAQNVAFSKGLKFYGVPIISIVPGSSLSVGARVVFCSDSRYTALGVSRSIIIRTLSATASINIGSDVGLSGTVICCTKAVSIGDGCLIGADVQITDTDFHPLSSNNRRYDNRQEAIKSAPIVIGANVFVGAGVRVLKGVKIGDNSIIGAGSVVAKDIPANVIAAGVPAKVLSRLQ